MFRDIYYRNMSIDQEERRQNGFDGVLGVLSTYSAKKKESIEAKNRVLNNANKFYKGREKIVEGFKNGIFPLNHDQEEEQTRYEEEKIRNENGVTDYKRPKRLIDLKNRNINDELVRKYFQVQDLGELVKKLEKSKNNTERNEITVALIKIELRNFK